MDFEALAAFCMWANSLQVRQDSPTDPYLYPHPTIPTPLPHALSKKVYWSANALFVPFPCLQVAFKVPDASFAWAIRMLCQCAAYRAAF